MTKIECLAKAAAARIELDAAISRSAIIISAFGGKSELAASADVERARLAVSEWMRLSRLHPQTRAAEVRSWAKAAA